MMTRLLVVNLILVIVYMTAWFLLARKRQRLDTVDSAWGGGFVLIAWAVAVQQPSAASLAIALLVTIWSARLTLHIARRSRRQGDDPRYVEMTRKWRGNVWLRAYFSIFLLQGVLIWLVGLPITLAAGEPLAGLMWLVLAGTAVWLAGFVIEAIADRQLAGFLTVAKNKGKLLDSGLWHYSRHPNYFGELLQWWGIGLIALQASYGWIGLFGPLLLTLLIVFVSGIPPIEKRRQGDPAYQAYRRRTSPLILLPPKG